MKKLFCVLMFSLMASEIVAAPGLTAYLQLTSSNHPLELKNPAASSSFSALNASYFIASHQNPDGGFSEKWIEKTRMAIEALSALQALNAIDVKRTELWITQHVLPWDAASTHEAVESLRLLGALDAIDKTRVKEVVASWQQADGSWGNLWDTYHCVSILSILNGLDKINRTASVSWVASKQSSDGGFHHFSDSSNVGETFCGIKSAIMLDSLNGINESGAVEWLVSCQRGEGGFGERPSWGSDTRWTYFCVSALADLKRLEEINVAGAVNWLVDCQKQNGGFEEPWSVFSWFDDTCWCISALGALNSLNSVDQTSATKFILGYYDRVEGGFRWEGDAWKTYRAISTWMLLKKALATMGPDGNKNLMKPDLKAAQRFLSRCENPDGGFAGHRGWGSNTDSTYASVASLKLLGKAQEIDLQDTVYYLVECQRPEGGFGNGPGDQPWIRQTRSAIEALNILGSLDKIDKNSAIRWILSCQNPDNGFSNRPEDTQSVCLETYYALQSLYLLGGQADLDKEKIIDWIVSLQEADGSFQRSVEQTYGAIQALSLLNALERINVTITGNYLTNLQKADGGFVWWEGDTWTWLDSTYYAISSLSILFRTKTAKAAVRFEPHSLNLYSRGKWISCHIELEKGCNVRDIDVSTILLNETIPAETHPGEIGDYDNDGIPDLKVKFDRFKVEEYILGRLKSPPSKLSQVTLTVTGRLYDGTLFLGSNTIRVIYRLFR